MRPASARSCRRFRRPVCCSVESRSAVAAWRGVAAGVAGSLLATFAFNYFFLPPVGTFHIADTSNWVALGAFLFAAIIASQLVTRARRHAVEAEARRREIMRDRPNRRDPIAATRS